MREATTIVRHIKIYDWGRSAAIAALEKSRRFSLFRGHPELDVDLVDTAGKK